MPYNDYILLNFTGRSQRQVLFFSGRAKDLPGPGVAPPLTRCQILRLKCAKFDFRWGSAPRPRCGAYSAPPDTLAVFKGPTSTRKEGKGEGKRRG